MSSRIGLTHEQIVEMTGYRRKALQVQALAEMGVPHIVRRDGSPFVSRAVLNNGLAIEEELAPATWIA